MVTSFWAQSYEEKMKLTLQKRALTLQKRAFCVFFACFLRVFPYMGACRSHFSDKSGDFFVMWKMFCNFTTHKWCATHLKGYGKKIVLRDIALYLSVVGGEGNPEASCSGHAAKDVVRQEADDGVAARGRLST